MEQGADPPAQGAGRETTFQSVFMAEYASMVALGAAVSGNRSHAEDIAQEAMLRLHRNWPKVQAYGKPGAWLRRITINLALSQKRRLTAEAKALVRVGTPRPELPPPLSDDGEIWGLVSALSKKQRAVVALHYLEDLSFEDIAEILGISASTVRVHLYRAKQSLHGSLTESPTNPHAKEPGQ